MMKTKENVRQTVERMKKKLTERNRVVIHMLKGPRQENIRII